MLGYNATEIKKTIKKEFPVQEFIEFKKEFKSFDELMGRKFNFIIKFKVKKAIDKCSDCGRDIYGAVGYFHKKKVCKKCYQWDYEKDRHKRSMEEIRKRQKLAKNLQCL
jgi:hypothetical protein